METSENTLREFPLVIATVAKVSRKRGLWLVVRVKKGDTRRYLHFYSFSSAASYVGMIQIRFPGQDIFSLLSARSDYGLPFSFNDLHYTTLLIFAQCIMTVICCIVNIFDHDIVSVISVGLNKYTVSDLMSLYRFAEW